MSVGPVEVVVIEFPGSRFNGRIVPELERLIAAGTISIIDGLLVLKDDEGATTLVEIDEDGLGQDVAALAAVCDRFDELISDEDVAELTADLAPGSAAAVLVFEHTWVRPLREAVLDSGGELTASFRVPHDAVVEVLAALETAS